MSEGDWVAKAVGEVDVGDRLRLRSGTVMTVTRIETPFMGMENLVCFVEDSDARWLAMPMPATAEVTVRPAARF